MLHSQIKTTQTYFSIPSQVTLMRLCSFKLFLLTLLNIIKTRKNKKREENQTYVALEIK